MKFAASLLLVFLTLQSYSQKRYNAKDIIDDRYGITMYNRLIRAAEGDSTRMCQGKPCQGYVKDFYTAGKLMHKGYYVDGMIRVFTNYWPNGEKERNFHLTDDHKAKLKVFYESGAVKSEVHYNDGGVTAWSDYYENGETEFEEKYVKSHDHIEFRRFFFEDGSPNNIIEFEKRGKKLYKQTIYHRNGKVKETGNLIYSDTAFDYLKTGDWNYYNDSGKLLKTVSYTMGRITHTDKFE